MYNFHHGREPDPEDVALFFWLPVLVVLLPVGALVWALIESLIQKAIGG